MNCKKVNCDYAKSGEILFSTDEVQPEFRVKIKPNGEIQYLPRDYFGYTFCTGRIKNLNKLFSILHNTFGESIIVIRTNN